MCFEKVNNDAIEVHFDIMREDDRMVHAGKEDLGKMNRRIG